MHWFSGKCQTNLPLIWLSLNLALVARKIWKKSGLFLSWNKWRVKSLVIFKSKSFEASLICIISESENYCHVHMSKLLNIIRPRNYKGIKIAPSSEDWYEDSGLSPQQSCPEDWENSGQEMAIIERVSMRLSYSSALPWEGSSPWSSLVLPKSCLSVALFVSCCCFCC